MFKTVRSMIECLIVLFNLPLSNKIRNQWEINEARKQQESKAKQLRQIDEFKKNFSEDLIQRIKQICSISKEDVLREYVTFQKGGNNLILVIEVYAPKIIEIINNISPNPVYISYGRLDDCGRSGYISFYPSTQSKIVIQAHDYPDYWINELKGYHEIPVGWRTSPWDLTKQIVSEVKLQRI